MSIQLDDGTDLMLYQFRRADGTRDRHSNGTLVDINGESRRLSAEQFTLTPVDYWTSPTSGARYPIAWRIEIPEKSISMTARAAIRNQELETNESTRVTYWEGATVLEGTDGRPLGRGYLEMTGYSGAAMGAFKN
jgi:predicted secreted hydrolase